MPVIGVRRSLWRAVALYRVVTLVTCLALIGARWDQYSRPWVAVLVGAGMAIVTAVVAYLAVNGRADRPAIVVGDLIATVGLTLGTIGANTPTQLHDGAATLTTIWAAGPVLEAAFLFGWIGGLVSASIQLSAAAIVSGRVGGRTVDSAIILLVAGAITGYVTRLAIKAEAALAEAERTRAALTERERLASGIHDGVLQVLALVHRAGRDEPGEWSRLATEAAVQETALRTLLSSRPAATVAGSRDVAAGLRALAAERVTVSTGADAVFLAASTATELEAAVRAALHNVARHAGADARAWILLEDLGPNVAVTVRDDGAGFAADRLADAATDGRLGVTASIRGRIERLGGQVRIDSALGAGTTIELLVPRVAPRTPR